MHSVKSTFFTDPYLMIVAGSFFALTAGLNGEPLFRRPSFRYGLIVALVITIAAAFFYVIKPEWMFMYVIRGKEAPWWLGPSLFCFYPFPYMASYALGVELKKQRKNFAFLWAGITSLSALMMHAVILDRWTSWVTTDDFASGKRGGFFTTPLYIYLGLSIIISVACTLYYLRLSLQKEKSDNK